MLLVLFAYRGCNLPQTGNARVPLLRLFCLRLKEQTEAAGVALGPTCKWAHAASHLAALHSCEVESFRFESSVEKTAREVSVMSAICIPPKFSRKPGT